MSGISLNPSVPQPICATVIFSLGATNPAPPSTCRGTIVNAAAAAPPVAMNFRRETPGGRDCFGLSLVFIPDLITKVAGRMQASSIRTIPGIGCPEEHQELQSTRHRLRPSNPVGPVNKIKEAMKRSELIKRYRIAENNDFRLADVKPTDTWKIKSKEHAQEWLEKG